MKIGDIVKLWDHEGIYGDACCWYCNGVITQIDKNNCPRSVCDNDRFKHNCLHVTCLEHHKEIANGLCERRFELVKKLKSLECNICNSSSCICKILRRAEKFIG